jgi:hypothetical protein
MRFVATITLMVGLIVPTIAFGQGRLQAVRDEIIGSAPSSPSTPSPSGRPCDSVNDGFDPNPNRNANTATSNQNSSGSSSSDNFFSILALEYVGLPWVIPHRIFDAGFPIAARFSNFPYAVVDGNYIVTEIASMKSNSFLFDREDLKPWSIRATGEVGSNFDGLTRVGLRGFLDTSSRFGIKTDWDYFSERLPCGCRDQMWLSDITGTYRFVQNDYLTMQTGIGVRLSFDRGLTHGGINVLYSADLFPTKPIHLSSSFEFGTIGSTDLIRGRIGAGANWRNLELFVGYDHFRIGKVTLNGPMLGLTLWY